MLVFAGSSTACSSDDPVDPPVETDLSGAYVLDSVTQGGVTLGPAEGATGTLTLTETRYTLSITVPSLTGPITTEDTGTYQTDGDTWTQESDNAGGFQGVGTFTLVGGTLTVDVTTAGVQVLSVWSLSA
jgi:hypothetical protein